MSNLYNIPKAIYTDEATLFIADRHHITPQEAVQASFSQCEADSAVRGQTPHLENNEVEIIKGLIEAYLTKNNPHI